MFKCSSENMKLQIRPRLLTSESTKEVFIPHIFRYTHYKVPTNYICISHFVHLYRYVTFCETLLLMVCWIPFRCSYLLTSTPIIK